MSYWDISDMAQNEDMLNRVKACVAQEHPDADPETWVSTYMLKVCASPNWGESWASALANLNITQPGKDPSVISDGMILSAVQPIVAEPKEGELGWTGVG